MAAYFSIKHDACVPLKHVACSIEYRRQQVDRKENARQAAGCMCPVTAFGDIAVEAQSASRRRYDEADDMTRRWKLERHRIHIGTTMYVSEKKPETRLPDN